jgi:hypothetical protein
MLPFGFASGTRPNSEINSLSEIFVLKTEFSRIDAALAHRESAESSA